jgi:hypothetical protein
MYCILNVTVCLGFILWVCGKDLYWLFLGGSRAARDHIAVNGIPNSLNYCVTFNVYT